ncbi:Hypothetical protein, putative [Bodo saltans]|uniref:Uncharacterized protein n=1 Tax=Bodo saltans TaxID=75058 RepID=A0A0S4IXZ1_BODSA|nr:Hypothetical protein, putative [Bodo saltans]|eukprot:CUF94587.1 Hypothetical protein, putative [Bodo saltans]
MSSNDGESPQTDGEVICSEVVGPDGVQNATLESANAKLLHRVQLLEQELVERNKECASLRTENRVMQSYNSVLKATQGELLRIQKTCVELQTSNAAMALKLRELEVARSKAEHKEKMDAIRKKLDDEHHHTTAGPSTQLSSSSTYGLGQSATATPQPQSGTSNKMGGIVPTAYGSEVVLAPTAISSLGFATNPRGTVQPSSKQPNPSVSELGAGHLPSTSPYQPHDETDEVNHLLSMVGDAAAHDTKKQQMDMNDEDELFARFAALQQRR